MGNAGLTGFMNVALVLLIIGVTVLLLMVQLELGPLAKLSPPRRWLMTLVLGSGMVAFSIKLIILETLVHFPRQTISMSVSAAPAALAPDWEKLNQDTPKLQLSGLPYPYIWRTLPEVSPAPAWNPTTPEKVALGNRLFHDKALSVDRTVSCSSCHDVLHGAGEDHRAHSLGIRQQEGNRNAPTVWNAGFQSVLFWDGRAASLEDQAMGPPVNPKEMGMPNLQAVEERVKADPEYQAAFARVFGAEQPITIREIAGAIAAYERTLITTDTPYDRFVRGDDKALNASQLRGMSLFQSVGCVMCHSGPNFSGASVFDPPAAPYRLFPVFASPRYMERYHLLEDVGANIPGSTQAVWRIPSLRNVALTAPYFHNGSVDSLAEAVRIMATVQRGKHVSNNARDNETLFWSSQAKTIARVEAAPLSDRDVNDIVAFLQALSSDRLLALNRK